MSETDATEAGKRADRRGLLTTFGHMVGRQGATAIVGLGYWVLITHLFTTRAVGIAAAATSTTAFLGAVGALGVPLLFLAEISRIEPSKRRVVFTTGMGVSGVVLLLLAVGTLALSPVFGKSLRIIAEDPALAVMFVVGAVATVTTNTFDNAALGLRRGTAQLWRATLASVLKVVFVGLFVVAGTKSTFGLLFSWVAGLVVSMLVCAPMLRLGPRSFSNGLRQRRVDVVRQYGRLSINHHVLNLSLSVPFFLVPAFATILVGPEQVAYFVTANLLQSTVMVAPYLLALALFAERPGDPDLLRRHLRLTLPTSLAICAVIVLGVELAAPTALQFFGPNYAAHGSIVLRLLALVGPSYVIKDHYVAIERSRGHIVPAAKVVAVGTALEIVSAAVGGIYKGGAGLALGWAIGAACLAAALLPRVLEQAYGRRPRTRLAEDERL